MENQPKKLITRLLEFAALFALSAFLIRLAVCYILSVWKILLIIAIVIAAGAIGWRFWKSRAKW